MSQKVATSISYLGTKSAYRPKYTTNHFTTFTIVEKIKSKFVYQVLTSQNSYQCNCAKATKDAHTVALRTSGQKGKCRDQKRTLLYLKLHTKESTHAAKLNCHLHPRKRT